MKNNPTKTPKKGLRQKPIVDNEEHFPSLAPIDNSKKENKEIIVPRESRKTRAEAPQDKKEVVTNETTSEIKDSESKDIIKER